MNRKMSLLCLLMLSSTALGLTIFKSTDGNFYRIVAPKNGPPAFELVTVIDLTGEEPTPPIPPSPPDGVDLVKVSAAAYAKVPDYAGKEMDAIKLAAYYTGISQQVALGVFEKGTQEETNEALRKAIETVFGLAVGVNKDKWQGWYDTTRLAFKQAPLNTKEDAAKGLKDIADGLMQNQAEDANFDFESFLKFFFEKIWPLIVLLIGGGK